MRVAIFIFTLLCCSLAKGQLTANFKADTLQGCAPLAVQFTDLSTGNPTSYSWDLGNGTKVSVKNPGTIYFNPGNYTVKLVVRNASGADSITKTQYIIATSKPDVQFVADKTKGCLPLNVKFTDQTNAGSGTIVRWEWNFGDGTTSNQQSPTHNYTVAGNFNVVLRVTNSAGCTTVETKPAFINTLPTPKAGFTSEASSSCSPPVNVKFTNTSVGNSIISTEWNFGDNATSSSTNPSHTYNTSGTFNVKLLLTNREGCTDTVTRPVVIGKLSPDFRTPDTVCQGTPITIVNTSSPSTGSSFWQFSDGTTADTVDVTKVFNTPGPVSIKLVNNFGACKDSITKTINVRPKPDADFSYKVPAAGCQLPVNVSFTSQAPAATSYLWNFGDSSTSTAANPIHSYAKFGTYSVQLKATGTNGCANTVIKANIISIVTPHIDSFNNLPYSGCLPYEHTFSAKINSSDTITGYLWNFGDNTTSTAEKPVHRYDKEGKYDVSLIISTSSGCKDTLRVPSAVVLGSRPVADFSATPLNGCAHDSVTFTSLSKGTITDYKWIFGDNSISTDEKPRHHYVDTGFFSVSLLVGNNGCYDSITKKNLVYIKPPIGIFEVLANCNSPFSKQFINKSKGAETSTWNFGDGQKSNDISPVHVYQSPGTYIVSLRVTNGACFDETFDTVRVIDEKPDFVTDDNKVCRNSPTKFTATNINVANIATYTWDFGDGTDPLVTTVPTATHIYTAFGVVSPSLTITNKIGCTKIVQHPLSLTIFGPKAAFSNSEGTCVNRTITFTSQSVPSGSYPIVSYIMDYGDGKKDSTTNPVFSHTYTTAGTYTVSLTVIDAFGCKDIFVKDKAVIITAPKASFILPDSISCKQSTLPITNTSSGLGLNYFWSFGDGGTSTDPNPIHSYTNEGYYNISLKVVDRFGCTDSISKTNAVLVKNAVAGFSLNDSIINCPPAEITFYNTSKFASSISWNFGDGNVSNVDTPIHYFAVAGTYRVKLVAKGFGSCADSVFKTVVVKGPSGSFTYNRISSCAPASINFSANAINKTSYTWDFGDGTLVSTTASNISHVYTAIGKYLPKLLLRDTVLGCIVTVFGKDTITVSGVTAGISKIPALYCDSATIQFADSSIAQFDAITSYVWNFGDGGTSNVRNPVHKYSTTGIFPVNLIVRTANGCIDTAKNLSIKIVKSPALSVTGDKIICVDQSASFAAVVARDTSAITWFWDFANGVTSTLQSPPPQKFATAGNYSVYTRVTNSSGCIDTIRSLLVVNPLPSINAGEDSIICRGQSVTLTPSGGSSYAWAPNPTLSCTNCTNPVANTVVDKNVYVVTGTSALGCKATDSLLVTVVQPFSINTSPLDTLCKGDKFELWANGADNYTWSPSNGLSSTTISNPVAGPDVTTTYQVIGRDYRNCFADTAYIPVVVYPKPVFNIVQETINLAVGNSVTLNTTNSPDIIKWQWSPPAGLSCNNCAQPTASPVNSTTYRAVASNIAGCTGEDVVTINLFCNNGNVFVPNTFSPNGDGSNDVFFPRGKGIAGIRNLQVFNRYGQIVFQNKNLDINRPEGGWDGKFMGQPLNPDVFVYQMEVICETGEVFPVKGNVSLIR